MRVPVATSKGRNLHILGAISSERLIKYTIKRGSFTAELCREWIKEMIQTLTTEHRESFVVVCDNAPCHSGLEAVFTHERVQLVRLGPYSPALNPIEIIWSAVKNYIKQQLRIGYSQMLEGDPQQLLNKQEWRMQFLEKIALGGQTCITPALCASAVNHVRQSYEPVLLGEEI